MSTDDLAAILGTDVSENPLAVIALDSACQKIRDFCDRTFNLTSDTVRLDGSGTDALLLESPVVEIISVTIDPDGSATELTAETDYALGKESILWRLMGTCWPVGRNNIEIEYSWGYAVSEDDVADDGPQRVPSSIREIALELAARIFLNSGVGQDEEQVSAGTPGATGLLQQERIDLWPYRRVVVA
ncbi:MAG: hypothetical protein ACRDH7_09280 [Actinomycetota bacterium]